MDKAKALKLIVIGFSLIFMLSKTLRNIIYKNISISEPLGYYLALPLVPYTTNDLVLTCLSNNSYKHVFNELGLKDNNACPNGMPYLLKTIKAVAGDTVEVIGNGVVINGRLQINSQQFIEGRGVKLYPLPVGYKHTLVMGEYFVLGESSHSIDSRYFGIIKEKDIYRRAILIYRTSS